MKRVWLVVSAVFTVMFFVNRRRHRSRRSSGTAATQHRARPIQVHIQENKREWLRANAVAIFGTIVALTGTAAAICFALQTNEINDTQTKILRQQEKVQESQSLPSLTIRNQYDTRADGRVVADWLSISTSGGMMSNLSVQAVPVAQFSWGDFYGDHFQTKQRIAVEHYTENEVFTSIGDYGNKPIKFGSERNVELLRQAQRGAFSVIKRYENINYSFIFVEWAISISYQDYQGIYRRSYYDMPGYGYTYFENNSYIENKNMGDAYPIDIKTWEEYAVGSGRYRSSGMYISLGTPSYPNDANARLFVEEIERNKYLAVSIPKKPGRSVERSQDLPGTPIGSAP